jgi:hypothetical protein
MENVSPVTVRKFCTNCELSTDKTAKDAGSAMRYDSDKARGGKRKADIRDERREGRRIRDRVCNCSCWNFEVIVDLDDDDSD